MIPISPCRRSSIPTRNKLLIPVFSEELQPKLFLNLKNSLKEVIQPLLPQRLPCYDFTPVIGQTINACLLAVSSAFSGVANFHGVTGGVYKARERIHRGVLIHDY